MHLDVWNANCRICWYGQLNENTDNWVTSVICGMKRSFLQSADCQEFSETDLTQQLLINIKKTVLFLMFHCQHFISNGWVRDPHSVRVGGRFPSQKGMSGECWGRFYWIISACIFVLINYPSPNNELRWNIHSHLLCLGLQMNALLAGNTCPLWLFLMALTTTSKTPCFFICPVSPTPSKQYLGYHVSGKFPFK